MLKGKIESTLMAGTLSLSGLGVLATIAAPAALASTNSVSSSSTSVGKTVVTPDKKSSTPEKKSSTPEKKRSIPDSSAARKAGVTERKA